MFNLKFTTEARAQYLALKENPGFAKRHKAVRKALALLGQNPRHPGLQTHKYDDLPGCGGIEVFEAYAENQTPGAYRIFWRYGPPRGVITLLAITEHP